MESIHTAAGLISDDLGYHKSYSLKIGTMWSIINPPGSANRAHIHPGCTWSGVYYIQAPAGCGNIEFIDPRTENLMQQPRYMPEQEAAEALLDQGQHHAEARQDADLPELALPLGRAEPQRRDRPRRQRVIISFNLSQQKI